MSGKNAQTYIANLDTAFDDDPVAFEAFRMGVTSGTMTWTVDGDTMTVVSSALGTFTGSLSTYTLQGLVTALVGAGFVVGEYDPEQGALSAAVLIDGTGSVNDPLQAYSSFIWSIGEAIGVELAAAGEASDEAIACATMMTATSVWLELWGSYFGVEKQANELDPDYARRIVVEVLRPRCNNVAIEMALEEVFLQSVGVVDVVERGPASPAHDGTILFDGTHLHNSSASVLWGLFDVVIGYDLLSGADPVSYLVIVRAIVDRLRAAGTYLRNLTLTASVVTDAAPMPVDGDMPLSVDVPLTDSCAPPTEVRLSLNGNVDLGADAVDPAADSLTLTIVYANNFHHDGVYLFDASKLHNSGATVVEAL